jgi:hypothetical protein
LSFIQPGGNLTAAERARAESDLRGHLLQALGGLVLVAGAYFTGRTFALNREGQITERFTRAVEQLANDEKLDIRLGGIYALERIARDSETHYEPVMQVLTAFLREHARWQTEASALPPDVLVESDVTKLRFDIQAAASVIGRRDRGHERPGYSLNLGGVDLRRAMLQGADLEEADLAEAHLEWAVLAAANLKDAYLARAHLERAYVTWDADLEGAVLEGAHLEGAVLKGAHLEGADLSKATGLTQSQLAEAIMDDHTKPPEYLGGEAGE